LIWFLITATWISLSGVLAPGPMTAATLAAGARRRHAGAWIALGHAVVELPLMAVIFAGTAVNFQDDYFKLATGLAGGAFLLLMGVQLLTAARKTTDETIDSPQRHPLLIGIILTGANPYFLIWWAAAGPKLASMAVPFGITAWALFAVIHWLCDLVWLEALSLASYKGTELLGGRLQQIVLVACGLTVLCFGCKFLYDAGYILRTLVNNG